MRTNLSVFDNVVFRQPGTKVAVSWQRNGLATPNFQLNAYNKVNAKIHKNLRIFLADLCHIFVCTVTLGIAVVYQH